MSKRTRNMIALYAGVNAFLGALFSSAILADFLPEKWVGLAIAVQTAVDVGITVGLASRQSGTVERAGRR